MKRKLVLYDGMLNSIAKLFKHKATVNQDTELIFIKYGTVHDYKNREGYFLLGWRKLDDTWKNNVPNDVIKSLFGIFKPQFNQAQKNDLGKINKVFEGKSTLISDLLPVALYNITQKLDKNAYFKNYFAKDMSVKESIKAFNDNKTNEDFIGINEFYKHISFGSADNHYNLLLLESYNPEKLVEILLTRFTPKQIPKTIIYCKAEERMFYHPSQSECAYLSVPNDKVTDEVKALILNNKI